MKVLQTLGRHGGAQEGVFQYKRDVDGVLINATISNANLNPNVIRLSHAEWTSILAAIAQANGETFRLTGAPPFPAPPNQSLYELLPTAVRNPAGGWQWNDSWKSYICAILEHEGSIDLYHGTLGPQHVAIIALRRDV
ncbi:MAG: hypothetical protein HY898_25025 [Deltaproteobacteria bacterium]|nr:hypothetical protein [Deltaproteobacteria bacterium]